LRAYFLPKSLRSRFHFFWAGFMARPPLGNYANRLMPLPRRERRDLAQGAAIIACRATDPDGATEYFAGVSRRIPPGLSVVQIQQFAEHEIRAVGALTQH
jgi:hypothetical protein